MSSLEAVPFLSEREPITPSSPIFKSQPFSFQSSALKFGGLLVYTILISVVSIQIFREGQNECRALTKDFIGNYIEYKPKRFISSAESKYSGKPNFEKDAAWRQLLGQQLIRLTSSEIRRNGISTLPSQESPGFIATTTFWHELHCIWYLRETLYQDHHHPNISAEMAQPRVTHSDHCLHMLQQSVMCSGDTSLLGLDWKPGVGHPTIQSSLLPHTCIDWEKLEDVLRPRVVSSHEALNLKNPLGTL